MTQPAEVTSRLDWHDLITALHDTVDAIAHLRQGIAHRTNQEKPMTYADDPDAEIIAEERRREADRAAEANGSDPSDGLHPADEPDLE